MKKKVSAESWSVNTVPQGHNLDDPFLPTGIDLEPEVHPQNETQLFASFKLNAAKRLSSSLGLRKASIMPSNQAVGNDTHISSVEDEE